MTGGIKSLAKDTAVYGISSILGKTLNWLLTPLFTYTLATTGEYGIVTTIYAYAALVIIVLTFGMETGFFRFANRNGQYSPELVYSTTLIAVGSVVLAFLALAIIFLHPLTELFNGLIPECYLLMILPVLSMDAFCCIPFAHLRYRQKALRFAGLKMLFIVLYIAFCYFFLVICPSLHEGHAEWIGWFYRPGFQVGYILLANLLATFIQTCCLLPELTGFRYRFSKALFGKMLRFSLPLLILGVAGMLSQTADKIIFPLVYPDREDAMNQLGIYGACFKIAVVMVMFTQAFRYAYEPFIFAKNKHRDSRQVYAETMKYFVMLGLLIFLGLVFYIDVVKFFVAPEYYEGLWVVPVVMMGELFFGIYFNLSLWYKLTDKTGWGALFSIAGSVVVVAGNILFIPRFGYAACAWASFVGYLFIMLLSYFVGQKKYRIDYDLRSFFLYMGLAASLYVACRCVEIEDLAWRLVFRTGLLGIYVWVGVRREWKG